MRNKSSNRQSAQKNQRSLSSSEIDLNVIEAIRDWWAHRFQFAVITGLSVIVVGLFLFFFFQHQHSSRLHYSEIVFKTATSNTPISLERIINSSLIRSLIEEEEAFLNLEAQQIINNLSLNRFYPQADIMTDQILNLNDATLKKLVLSGDQLENTVVQLNNLSRQHYTLRLIHNQTSLSPDQSEFLLNTLVDEFNQKTSQSVDFQNTRLFTLENIDESDLNNQILLFEKLNAIRSNLRIIKNDYSELVTQTDFSTIQTQLNQLDQFLFHSVDLANDEITIRLENQVEELRSKLQSLYDILELIQNNQNVLPSYGNSSMGENNTIAQINNDSIQSLLSLGKELSAVDIINQLADEIKQLSFQKAEIESQLLLNQRLKLGNNNKKDITINQVNSIINQLNRLIELVVIEKNPDRYLNVTIPPRYYSDSKSAQKTFWKYWLIISLLLSLGIFLAYLLRYQFKKAS